MSEEDKEIEEVEEPTVEELKAQLKAKEDAEKAIVEELRAEREQRQKAQKELETKEEPSQPSEGDDPRKLVQEELSRAKKEEQKQNFEQALREFKSRNQEFSPDNDTAGIVFNKFENELKKFNMEGLSSKEDYLNRLNEVYEFMNRRKPKEKEAPPYYSGTPSSSGSEPPKEDDANLNDAEKRLMKDFNISKEKYLEIKAKRPGYVASLLKHRQ